MTPLLRNRLARKQRLSLAVLLLLVLAASMMLLAIPPRRFRLARGRELAT